MDDINIILNDIYEDIKYKNLINIMEIGTGNGQNSTKKIYDFFFKKKNKFNLDSYEGDLKCFNRANNYWKNKQNVRIINKYFSNKEDIIKLLIPNLPEYIIDYKESNQRFKEKYLKIYNSKDNNYVQNINFIPNIIFIDCSRFMHLTIINYCFEFIKENSDCIFIIEDDYFINDNYGELEIIERVFNLSDVKKYKKGTWQWPFVSFKIKNKKI